MAGSWRATFPGEPASARHARRFVEQALTEDGKSDLIDTALLLVSELVTNALLHASSGVTLVVSSDDKGATIEVHDGSPVFPAVRRYGLDAATGRGLLLVEDLSTVWDVEATDTGKKIWFRLRSTDGHAGDSALGAALLAGLDLGDVLDAPAEGTSARPGDRRRQPSDPRLTEGVRRG
jgi:anti-sigma regulatory factor (Ser/Thr protein kinase)